MSVEQAKCEFLESKFSVCIGVLKQLSEDDISVFFNLDVVKNDYRIFHLTAELISGDGDHSGKGDRSQGSGDRDHSRGHSGDRDHSGGSEDKHHSGGSRGRHHSGGSGDRDHSGGHSGKGDHSGGHSGDRDGSGGSSDRDRSGCHSGEGDRAGGSRDRDHSGGHSGSGDKDGSGGSGDKDRSGGSGDRDRSGGSGDRDRSGGSGDRDRSGGSGDRDRSGGSGDRDRSGGSGDRDRSGGSGGSGDKDRSGGSGDRDGSGGSGDKDHGIDTKKHIHKNIHRLVKKGSRKVRIRSDYGTTSYLCPEYQIGVNAWQWAIFGTDAYLKSEERFKNGSVFDMVSARGPNEFTLHSHHGVESLLGVHFKLGEGENACQQAFFGSTSVMERKPFEEGQYFTLEPVDGGEKFKIKTNFGNTGYLGLTQTMNLWEYARFGTEHVLSTQYHKESDIFTLEFLDED